MHIFSIGKTGVTDAATYIFSIGELSDGTNAAKCTYSVSVKL